MQLHVMAPRTSNTNSIELTEIDTIIKLTCKKIAVKMKIESGNFLYVRPDLAEFKDRPVINGSGSD